MTETRLSSLTTMGVGGPPTTLVEAQDREAIVEAVRAADATHTPLLIVGGGSNLVVDDSGFAGTVVRIASRGVDFGDPDLTSGSSLVTVEAGHPWDEFVEQSVMEGYSGLEALSGIPGSSGATPVQNVGAYGADVSQRLVRVTVYDRGTDQIKELGVGDLRLEYRDSMIKRSIDHGAPRYVVLAVTFQLFATEEGRPVAYQQLADALGVALGERVSAALVRQTVLRLRGSKGMVLDPDDADTRSCGSFFTNPIVAKDSVASLPEDAPRFPVPESSDRVKLSAAWLIDHAGFHKGFGLEGTPGEALAGGRASLSTKHALAVTNRGEAASEDVLAIARAVRDGVEQAWGIRLEHEPQLVGCVL
ncbi:MAG: UDP-N-acetylmuramate dehydrogenase [Galactobacter sp.]